MTEDKTQPLLTQAGNPFPPHLTPVFVDMTPARGVPLERMWPRPLKEKDALVNYSGCVTMNEYLYETLDPRWPRFKLRLQPQGDETDAQYAAYRRDIEHHTMVHAIYLCLMHQICTVIGNHETCAVRACRRRGRCSGRRDEDKIAISFAIFPPCIPIDIDIIETYRVAAHEALKWICETGSEQEQAGRPTARKETAMAK
jgi:hypothetical protein